MHLTVVHFSSEMNSALFCYALPPLTIADTFIYQPRIFCFLPVPLTLNLTPAIPLTPTHSITVSPPSLSLTCCCSQEDEITHQ